MTLGEVGVITPERGMRKASPILHSNCVTFCPYEVWKHGGWCSVVGLAVSNTWYFSINANILPVKPQLLMFQGNVESPTECVLHS